MKQEFSCTMEYKSGGEFAAIVKVASDGFGEVYDADGLYCGSINPIKAMKMMKGAIKDERNQS